MSEWKDILATELILLAQNTKGATSKHYQDILNEKLSESRALLSQPPISEDI